MSRRAWRNAIAACGWVSVTMLVACAGPRPTAPVSATASTSAAQPGLQAAVDGRVADLLRRPLNDEAAVEVALLRNPTLTRLFDQLGLTTDRLKLGHEADPRHGGKPLGGEEPRIERASTASLMSWLAGASLADPNAAVLLSDAADRAGAVTFDVRRAWVDAVASNQRLDAEADAVLAALSARDLAERQWQVGNQPVLNALKAQQVATRALVKQTALKAAALVAQERLHAAMGLFFDEADAVQLPRTLPALPASPVPADALEVRAVSQRLDVQTARLVSTLPDIRATSTSPGRSDLHIHSHPLEYAEEAGIRARLEVRTAWIAYTAAHQIAVAHVDVLMPLATRISDEQTKRSNGMLIGLDMLLADAASRTAGTAESIEAQRRFWRAEIDLQQAMAGVGQIDTGSTGRSSGTGPVGEHATGTDH